MATVQLVVCDVCEDPTRGTRHYSIVSLGRKVEAELCDEHGRPLEHLLGDPRELDPLEPPTPIRTVATKRAARKSTAGKASTRGKRTMGAKVTTLDAIEASKK